MRKEDLMAVTVSLHHYCYPQICSNKEHTEIPSLPDRFTHHRCSVSPFIAENWMVKIRGFSLFLSAWVLNKWGIRVLKEGSTSPLSSSFLFITWFLLLFFWGRDPEESWRIHFSDSGCHSQLQHRQFLAWKRQPELESGTFVHPGCGCGYLGILGIIKKEKKP